jgi:hypothetical protein
VDRKGGQIFLALEVALVVGLLLVLVEICTVSRYPSSEVGFVVAVAQTKPRPQKVRAIGGQMRSPGQRSEPPRLTSLPVQGLIPPPTPRALTARSMPATRNIPASNRSRSNT